ncbi:putative GTP-dependent nucleic acid-binding protein EngD [Streptomyces sp. Tu6071]|nr:putative GTP-dependent nucleic acid-binding protein EngD [Streptomyces sp. Tu6071]
MDDSGRLGGRSALVDGPGAGFLGAGGQVGLEAQGLEADAGQGREAGFVLADGLEEFEGLLVVQFGEVRLQLRVEEDRLGRGDERALLGLEGVVRQLVLVHVEDVEEGLGREQVQVVEGGGLLRALRDALGEEGVARLQDRLRLLDRRQLGGHVLLDPGLLREAREDLLDRLEVGEDQLGVDRLDVVLRGDLAVDVHDVVVLEGADHLADRVRLADVREELVAQSLALARAAHDAGDVDEVHRRGEDTGRTEQLGELRQPGVRHAHDAHVRLDRREGVVRGQHVVLREGVEEGGLADIGQADDTDACAHGSLTKSARESEGGPSRYREAVRGRPGTVRQQGRRGQKRVSRTAGHGARRLRWCGGATQYAPTARQAVPPSPRRPARPPPAAAAGRAGARGPSASAAPPPYRLGCDPYPLPRARSPAHRARHRALRRGGDAARLRPRARGGVLGARVRAALPARERAHRAVGAARRPLRGPRRRAHRLRRGPRAARRERGRARGARGGGGDGARGARGVAVRRDGRGGGAGDGAQGADGAEAGRGLRTGQGPAAGVRGGRSRPAQPRSAARIAAPTIPALFWSCAGTRSARMPSMWGRNFSDLRLTPPPMTRSSGEKSISTWARYFSTRFAQCE